ncbi:MAG: hydrogenase 3 maturation endopeptidase HyCI [Kiritimatiellae bacterium]|jgi:hydrogenase 3 maturation protease|nr:hydrogenase 3 maturation endopeptidase HyCI [Kiritimatiellia bacterium]
MNLLLGIGNPGHGDDALGPIFARAFRHPNWRCINAATAPENFTGLIRRLHPDCLVLLDAADMGAPPGTLRRLDPDHISAASFGTHAGSIGQLATYLADCANHIVILGIQPAHTTPGSRLSPPVRATLKTLAHSLENSSAREL